MAMQWIKPPFLDASGNWLDTSTEDRPEGLWPFIGDPFLAAVALEDGGWHYAVVVFSEDGIELDCGDSSWDYAVEDITMIAKLEKPQEEGDGSR